MTLPSTKTKSHKNKLNKHSTMRTNSEFTETKSKSYMRKIKDQINTPKSIYKSKGIINYNSNTPIPSKYEYEWIDWITEYRKFKLPKNTGKVADEHILYRFI